MSKLEGQEFYDKFLKYFDHGLEIFTPEEQKIADERGKEWIVMEWAIEAAKKAAGIDE